MNDIGSLKLCKLCYSSSCEYWPQQRYRQKATGSLMTEYMTIHAIGTDASHHMEINARWSIKLYLPKCREQVTSDEFENRWHKLDKTEASVNDIQLHPSQTQPCRDDNEHGQSAPPSTRCHNALSPQSKEETAPHDNVNIVSFDTATEKRANRNIIHSINELTKITLDSNNWHNKNTKKTTK